MFNLLYFTFVSLVLIMSYEADAGNLKPQGSTLNSLDNNGKDFEKVIEIKEEISHARSFKEDDKNFMKGLHPILYLSLGFCYSELFTKFGGEMLTKLVWWMLLVVVFVACGSVEPAAVDSQPAAVLQLVKGIEKYETLGNQSYTLYSLGGIGTFTLTTPASGSYHICLFYEGQKPYEKLEGVEISTPDKTAVDYQFTDGCLTLHSAGATQLTVLFVDYYR